jgi:hypothetical protein
MFKDANLERFLYSSETDNVPMRQSGRGWKARTIGASAGSYDNKTAADWENK